MIEKLLEECYSSKYYCNESCTCNSPNEHTWIEILFNYVLKVNDYCEEINIPEHFKRKIINCAFGEIPNCVKKIDKPLSQEKCYIDYIDHELSTFNNCSYCINCINCYACLLCTNCTDCEEIENSLNCSNCFKVYYSTDCKHCVDTWFSNGCEKCITSINSSFCTNCKYIHDSAFLDNVNYVYNSTHKGYNCMLPGSKHQNRKMFDKSLKTRAHVVNETVNTIVNNNVIPVETVIYNHFVLEKFPNDICRVITKDYTYCYIGKYVIYGYSNTLVLYCGALVDNLTNKILYNGMFNFRIELNSKVKFNTNAIIYANNGEINHF